MSIVLTDEEANNILHALDVARDAIQPLTVAQIKLHHIPANTDKILDAAAEILMAKKNNPPKTKDRAAP